jgi:hypothetical protein
MLKLNVIISVFVLFFVGYSLAISENTISTFNFIQSDQKQQAIKKGFGLFRAGKLDESKLRKAANELAKKLTEVDW